MQIRIRTLKRLDATFGRLLAAALPPRRGGVVRPEAPKRLLLIRPGGIGDAVLLVPAILALRRCFPELVVHILAERRNAAVFDLCPAVAHVYRYDQPRDLLVVLRNRYDCIIDTEQWHRFSAVLTRLTRAPVTIGFETNERGRLFSHPIPYSHDDYEAESFYHLLAPLGVSGGGEGDPPFLTVPGDAWGEARQLLGGLGGAYVVIFPGASIPERRWGWERFRDVAGRLATDGVAVVVVGGKDDRADGGRIVAGTSGLNLAGLTGLGVTAAVIAGACLLVSGDSGVLHVGIGVGVPTVSLFGPGIVVKWGPIGERHRVISLGLPCSPCTRFGTTPHCPHGVRCLRDIAPDAVYAAVGELLGYCTAVKG